MKQINDLGITTIEGLSVKNLQRFPSMEWGPTGGLSADVFYKGKKILNLYQAGNGGCAVTYMTEYGNTILGEVREAGLSFLRRRDTAYTDGKYDWLTKKTVKTFNDDDWEAVVNCMEERYDDIKEAAKCFKKGYKAVALLKNYCETSLLQYRVEDITLEEVTDYLKQHELNKRFTSVTIVRNSDNFKEF